MTLTTYQKSLDFAPDAKSAQLDPNQGPAATLAGGGSGSWGYFIFEVPFQEIGSGDPSHQIRITQGNGNGQFYNNSNVLPRWKLGTKRGSTTDKHCSARDQTLGYVHELWGSEYGTDGEIDTAGGGNSLALTTLYNRNYNNYGTTNAAGFALRSGVITPDDFDAFKISHANIPNHAVVFTADHLGPSPRWPSIPIGYSSGYPTNPVQLGMWFRCNPAASTASITDEFELMLALMLQTYGAFCRDIGPTIAFQCVDTINQGGNDVVWQNAHGLTGLYAGGQDNRLYARQWSPALISWVKANLQVLVSPTTDAQLTALWVPSGTVAAPTVTSFPVVSGTPLVGQVLAVDHGNWNGSPSSYAYQWQRDGHGNGTFVAIAGATAATYTPVDADDSCNVRCQVIAANAGGNSAPAYSNSAKVIEPTPTNTVAPVVTGTPKVGIQLTGSNGTWTHMAGFNSNYTYQWQQSANGTTGWTNIAGATALTYTPVVGDVAKYLRLVVSAHNSGTS